MPNYMELLKQYPMIVNTYKGKIERARQMKREQGLSDELTREDLEPIMKNALNMVKSNIPASMKRPETIEELAVELKKSGVAKEFGLRDSEIDTMIEVTKEQLNVPAPMPQYNQSSPPKNFIKSQTPRTSGIR
jgi:hypothetical protein